MNPMRLGKLVLRRDLIESNGLPDGFLSSLPYGSVIRSPCPDAKVSPPEFKGRLRVFETFLWKPS